MPLINFRGRADPFGAGPLPRQRVVSPTIGRGEKLFLKYFQSSCGKNYGGFTGRQNFTVLISEGRADGREE